MHRHQTHAQASAQMRMFAWVSQVMPYAAYDRSDEDQCSGASCMFVTLADFCSLQALTVTMHKLHHKSLFAKLRTGDA